MRKTLFYNAIYIRQPGPEDFTPTISLLNRISLLGNGSIVSVSLWSKLSCLEYFVGCESAAVSALCPRKSRLLDLSRFSVACPDWCEL